MINVSVSLFCFSDHPLAVRRSVGPDLGPNCWQMLSADNKSGRAQRKNTKKKVGFAFIQFNSIFMCHSTTNGMLIAARTIFQIVK